MKAIDTLKMARLRVTEDDIGLKVLREPRKLETSDLLEIIEYDPLNIFTLILKGVIVLLQFTVLAHTLIILGARMSAQINRQQNMLTG